VQSDWATATLRDNSTNTTTTLLPPTCTNNGAWVQLDANVVAGRSYTLTLTNRDDGTWGDATYTYYDDVTLS
jgi:serine protease